MPTSFLLRVWTRFYATPEEVWAIKTDPEALAAEFQPWLRFSMDGEALRRAIEGGGGGEVASTLRPLGLPFGVGWPIRLGPATRPVAYSDSSENRIFSRFQHQHSIERTGDGCRYVDAVTFAPRMLPKAVGLMTERLFRHRHAVAARRLKSDPQATGVSVLRVLVEEEQPA
jgi:ligand-binding SRPBCC domain-containing protein